jgi:hypothetical protein
MADGRATAAGGGGSLGFGLRSSLTGVDFTGAAFASSDTLRRVLPEMVSTAAFERRGLRSPLRMLEVVMVSWRD